MKRTSLAGYLDFQRTRFQQTLLSFFCICLLWLFANVALVSAQVVVESETSANKTAAKVADDAATADFDFFSGDIPADVGQLRQMQEHFRKLAKDVAAATVNIQVGDSQGSGVIVTKDGYVMTAAHVIGDDNLPATIQLPDGTQLEARTLGLNRTIDAGLVKITQRGRYSYLGIGESESLTPGQWVMAIGHPGGWEKDRGLVFRIGRIIRSSETGLMTDCTLVGGDSGGPLVDMNGDVIGIHSRIGNSLSNNIHVPVDTFTETWDRLQSGEDWGRGIGGRDRSNEPWIGVRFKTGTLEIENVTPGGPAEKAGLQPGDIVVEFAGNKLSSPRVLGFRLLRVKPNDAVKIKYKRGDETIEVELTIGAQKDRPGR